MSEKAPRSANIPSSELPLGSRNWQVAAAREAQARGPQPMEDVLVAGEKNVENAADNAEPEIAGQQEDAVDTDPETTRLNRDLDNEHHRLSQELDAEFAKRKFEAIKAHPDDIANQMALLDAQQQADRAELDALYDADRKELNGETDQADAAETSEQTAETEPAAEEEPANAENDESPKKNADLVGMNEKDFAAHINALREARTKALDEVYAEYERVEGVPYDADKGRIKDVDEARDLAYGEDVSQSLKKNPDALKDPAVMKKMQELQAALSGKKIEDTAAEQQANNNTSASSERPGDDVPSYDRDDVTASGGKELDATEKALAEAKAAYGELPPEDADEKLAKAEPARGELPADDDDIAKRLAAATPAHGELPSDEEPGKENKPAGSEEPKGGFSGWVKRRMGKLLNKRLERIADRKDDDKEKGGSRTKRILGLVAAGSVLAGSAFLMAGDSADHAEKEAPRKSDKATSAPATPDGRQQIENDKQHANQEAAAIHDKWAPREREYPWDVVHRVMPEADAMEVLRVAVEQARADGKDVKIIDIANDKQSIQLGDSVDDPKVVMDTLGQYLPR